MERPKREAASRERGEFTVETLESVLLSEAGRRGERLYRITLSLRDECLFPWERLAVDMGRMENAFNVIRVSPELKEPRDLPERIVFHVTTALPFERAAEEAAFRLDGVVDIVEVPLSAWEEERGKWRADRLPKRHRPENEARAEAALLLLSYRVLRFDMERIIRACGPGQARDNAASSLGAFEERLSRLPASRLSLLVFTRKGIVHHLPRSFVAGYSCSGGSGGATCLVTDFDGPVLEPDLSSSGGPGRFGIVLSLGGKRSVVAADRLLCYREVESHSVTVTGRISSSCFQVTVEGRPGRLVLPPGKARKAS